MLHFVYELVDPRTDVVVYVGITNNPNQRFRVHLSDTGTNKNKGEWIEQLQGEHLEPRMRILEIVETKEEALEREKHWIQWYLQQGVALTNIKLLCYTPPSDRINLKNIDTTREYLTTPEAAERSGFTRIYLALLLRKGTLEGFRRGRDWFVYADSLEAFLTAPRKSGPKGPRKTSFRET